MVIRTLLVPVLVLASLPARAEVFVLDVHPPAARSVGLTSWLQSTKISGLTAEAYGPNLQLALGWRRWQGFVEGSYSWASVGPEGAEVLGRQARVGAGARYIARSIELESAGAIDLVLEGFAGWERYLWNDGTTLSRPDLGFGIGWQARLFVRSRQIVFRSMARVVFAPTDRDEASAVCRGTCTMPASASNSGLVAVIGFDW
jgi:hypothetical protein